MKFKGRSLKLLSITKSKAKMYEFGLDEEHHINMPESPNKLLIMTIGILGDLCREELSDKRNVEIYEQSSTELRNVARYFDALIESRLQTEYDYYLCLLGASSYYLADMPGSSIVLSKKFNKLKAKLTESGLENLLSWLLVSNFNAPFQSNSGTSLSSLMNRLTESINAYFNLRLNDKSLILKIVNDIRNYCHNRCSDRELLLSDIIVAIVQRKLKNSALNLLPEYTALSLDNWLPALSKPTFMTEFWPAQRLLGEAGVFKGTSAVIQLPTSTGKTKSAELIIRSSFLSGRASVAVIIAPFRSLCREISESLSEAFSNEDILVNQLNDIPQIDKFDVELFSQLFESENEITVNSTIIVATPEKLVYLLRQKPELAKIISLVIYDEGHQFDSGTRGVTYELLLTSLKCKLGIDTQHVLISAVLSNASSIGDWLYAGDGKVVNGADCLSTERSVAFSSWKRGLGQFHYVDLLDPNIEEFFVPRVLESFPIPLKGKERKQKFFPNKREKTSIAAYLGLKLSEQGSVAVFCGTRKTVASICKLIVAANERLPQLPTPREFSNSTEIDKIAKLASKHLGSNFPIVKAIEKGVLPHSAGIPNGIRVAIEFAMEHGLGKCVICTSTLAQGVNLPIKYLVVSGVFQGEGRIATRDFHNLLGRAGRAGKHTEGSIIFTDIELFDERNSSKRWQWDQMKYLLDSSRSEHCLSSLLTLAQPFENDQFSIDPIKFIKSPEKAKKLFIQAAKNENIEISNIISQMDMRMNYIRSVESFILANFDNEEIIYADILTKISNKKTIDAVYEFALPEEYGGKQSTEILFFIKNTLAYSLANMKEKEKIIQVFQVISENVNQIPAEKRRCYGKALLGISELESIEEWLFTNIDVLKNQTDILEILEYLWPMIEGFVVNNSLDKLIGDRLYFSKLWCQGMSYHEILLRANQKEYKFKAGKQQRNLTIENVIDICDHGLGYSIMLIIGACADLLEGLFDNPDVSKEIRKLQMVIKIGLSDDLAIYLYSLGLVDRIVASDIATILRASGSDLIFDKSVILKYRHIIEPELAKYPSVFSRSFYGI